jgi:hypothetical protein
MDTHMTRHEMTAHHDDPAEPWSFEMVDGKCIIHMDACELTEEAWKALEQDRVKFMQPTWAARRRAEEAEEKTARAAEEAKRQRTEEVEGVVFTVHLNRAGEPHRVEAGSKDGPYTIMLRYSEYGSNTSRWAARKLKEPRWYPFVYPNNYKMMGGEVTGDSGNTVSFKTWQAAAKAALDHYNKLFAKITKGEQK